MNCVREVKMTDQSTSQMHDSFSIDDRMDRISAYLVDVRSVVPNLSIPTPVPLLRAKWRRGPPRRAFLRG